jgi:hypothetical protein
MGNMRYTSTTEAKIASEITASVVGTLQMETSSFNQPFNLEINACIDKAVKVGICVF